MAYFPNGSSGMDYQDRYCDNCRNWRDTGDGRGHGCPIWDLHMIGDYDQCADTEIGKLWKKLLENLIPTKKDRIYPAQCAMFLPIGAQDIEGQMRMEFEP